jgi:HEAT repeat protein
MPEINVMVYKWLAQLDDWDQSSAFSAWQSLEQEVLRSSRPGNATGAETVAKAIAEALVAPKPERVRTDRLGKSSYKPGSRRIMARMLGYIPADAVLPQMAEAIKDLDVREMVRCSLEANPSEGATDLLIGALDHSGSTFRVGVVNSLARRKGAKVLAALKKSAADPQTEVRTAALEALADVPDPSLDTILSKATTSENPEEKQRAHVARAKLAATLKKANNKSAADRVCNSILASDAPDPQKNSAKRTLA